MSNLPPPAFVDYVAFAVLIAMPVLGYIRKFSGELARLLGLCIPFALALGFYRPGGRWLEAHSRLELHAATLGAFLVLLIVLLILCRLLRPLIKRIGEIVLPDVVDHALGILAGLIKGIAIVGIFFVTMNLAQSDYLRYTFGDASLVGSVTRACMPELKEIASEMLDDTQDRRPRRRRSSSQGER